VVEIQIEEERNDNMNEQSKENENNAKFHRRIGKTRILAILSI